MSIHFFRRQRYWLLVAAVLGLAVSVAWACDTPVYRYAMYRWEPAPYEIYLFHRGAIDDANVAILKTLEDAAFDDARRANVVTTAVNLDEDAALQSVPPDVRRAWQAQNESDLQLPTHMVLTPQGIPLFSGRLDEAAVAALLESPARKQVAQDLESGKAAVLLLLTGSDAAANEAAETMLAQLVADVAAGKVEFLSAPKPDDEPPVGKPAAEQPAAPDRPKIEISHIKLARDEAAERWLIDALLSIEDDLRSEDFHDDPMVFAVYGRGRALPPYVGPGVTRDNLIDCIEFVTGACSCTVKEQNPGLDLLVRHDWQKAAETLAAKFGAEEGNEAQLSTADFFPDLLIPGANGEAKPAGEPAAAEPAKTSAAETESPASSPPAVAKPVAEEAAPEVASSAGNAASVAAPATPAANQQQETPAEAFQGFLGRSVLVVGAGLALGLGLLFVITFLVLRPR